jgi:catechol 2,3-dioxygenase-like lactoylglutathione lyase family enzyme
MTQIASLVLYATDVQATTAFYRALGIDLEEEVHEEGPGHFAVELGPVHFAIYAADAAGKAPNRRGAGSCFPGFYVDVLSRSISGGTAPVHDYRAGTRHPSRQARCMPP